MWNRRVASSCMALAGLALVAACTDVPPMEPVVFEADGDISLMFAGPATQDLNSLDAVFAQMASEIPGFGGLYYDEAGDLNVVMARSSARERGGAELIRTLTARMQAHGLRVTEGAQRVRVHTGEYDFQQLHNWHRTALPVLAVPGVVYTDANEMTNRVQIGVERGTSRAAVEQAVAMLGIPMEAVTVVEAEPIVPLQIGNIGDLPTLRDRVRPTAGGLQINFVRGDPPAGFICTLGFNIRAPTVTREQGFLTNSHCTDTRGEVRNTPYWQPSRFVENTFIGVEVFDPPFFTDPCFAGWLCRYSDAAAVHYQIPRDEVAFGRIMSPFPGSIVLPSVTSHFRIAEEATSRPVLGQAVFKVGRSSGMTGGPVVGTCLNIGVSGTAPPVAMLCQEEVLIAAIGGDSGSPVVEPLGGDRVRLHGLVWGGSSTSFVYSSILNIRAEIPGPWITH